MKIQIRILLYAILFFLYLTSTSLLLSLGERLKTDPYITLGCGFAVLNIIYSFLGLKWKPVLNVVCSIVIAALSLYLAVQFANLHLLSKYDPYLVKTAIFTNAILSILFWEIVYQVKIRK
ncbi:hypothetical protein [Flavobacterium sp. N502536]|uniref:hypothetical protein n=1 Tax=Flavobacterium sp. N502536 TaxID=2986837 RepID=UPI002223A800|nr:hypothetical protein [Flavobacterium sp. N502536]